MTLANPGAPFAGDEGDEGDELPGEEGFCSVTAVFPSRIPRKIAHLGSGSDRAPNCCDPVDQG